MDKTLAALYEIKRQNFLIGFVQNPERFDDALAYAYEHRLAPVFHEGIMREAYGEDPFGDVYVVKAEFANDVLEFIDKCWGDKDWEPIQFYKLEEKFGGYKNKRMELKCVIEYARILHRFDDEVYAAIESNAPTECNKIYGTFSSEDVSFG